MRRCCDRFYLSACLPSSLRMPLRVLRASVVILFDPKN